jgi:hypothetical protein
MAARLPLVLMDDVIIEILLRLPPDDIACLAHASLVYKAWRRLLSDRAILRRYGSGPRARLALQQLLQQHIHSPLHPHHTVVPFPPPALSAVSPTYCQTLDCRHGHVLLFHPAYPSCFPYTSNFTVWDPITGK